MCFVRRIIVFTSNLRGYHYPPQTFLGSSLQHILSNAGFAHICGRAPKLVKINLRKQFVAYICAEFRAGTKFMDSMKLQYVDRFVFCVHFSKMCPPRWAGKRSSPNVENSDMFGFHRLYNDLKSFHMQTHAKKHPRCI